MEGENTQVKCAVRIRPLSSEERETDNNECIATTDNQVSIADSSFTFDHVFASNESQASIYERVARDLVISSIDGFNATILAYGQTGSGKTYTMGSCSDNSLYNSSESIGIIPRVIHDIFDIIKEREREDSNSIYKIQVQFLEIYGEDIKDLLDHTSTSKVSIRETVSGEVYVTGAKEEVVSSKAQLMKALDDGSQHRTTAATKMNNTSSRSHAIFTIMIQRTIHTPAPEGEDSQAGEDKENTADNTKDKQSALNVKSEVRCSKFHFVDLAGSERVKRTGAQGVQLKEGIDINKGLLALGNVISALGDDTKRGKVHVPYRDSKLTRMLQDSLGGNSKTLMICCVSPSVKNYSESLNALRYANRARNIQNKPVVNRDPAAMIVDELRLLLLKSSSELLLHRNAPGAAAVNKEVLGFTPLSIDQLLSLTRSKGGNAGAPVAAAAAPKYAATNPASLKAKTFTESSNSRSGHNNTISFNHVNSNGNSHLADADFEIKRLSEQIKLCRSQMSDVNEKFILMQSERDYYKMQLDSVLNKDSSIVPKSETERSENISTISDYLRRIDVLSAEVRDLKDKARSDGREEREDAMIDLDLTGSIARVIAQTKEMLRHESTKLRQARGVDDGTTLLNDGNAEDDEEASHRADVAIEAEETAFQKRQKLLSAEVAEIGESIKVKEQLVEQLQRSQQQYQVMKTFYEQRLQDLEEEVSVKTVEREALQRELQELSSITSKNDAAATKKAEKERRLAEDLRRKDEELRSLKKKQEEVSALSQAQVKYMSQLGQLEGEISSMKRQKIDLFKTLSKEKKAHFVAISEKAKEIERLKKNLARQSEEVKRLGREKDRADGRVKDMLRARQTAGNASLSLTGGSAGSASTNGHITGNKPKDSSSSSSSTVGGVFGQVAKRALAAAAKGSGSFRMLSDEEVRTKKWLEKRMAALAQREEIAFELRRQSEQQLTFVGKRATLEARKAEIESRIAIAGGIASEEDEEALGECEETLASLEGQLQIRNGRICQLQNELGDLTEDASTTHSVDKTVDALKRNVASTLPSAHDLLRLVVDMLVSSRKAALSKRNEALRAEEKWKETHSQLEETSSRLAALRRSHDTTFSRQAREYEEKLNSLFDHSSHSSGQVTRSVAAGVGDGSGYRALLAISGEQSSQLKEQLQAEQQKVSYLQAQLAEAAQSSHSLRREAEDRLVQIRYLEDERRLLQDVARDLRSGLSSAVGVEQSAAITRQVRERIRSKDTVGSNSLASTLNSNGSDSASDDECEAVLSEFDLLGEDISRNGTITNASSSRAVVYDRLTNPSNFTGSMKNVFEQDLEKKRRKVQQLKQDTVKRDVNKVQAKGVSDENDFYDTASSGATMTPFSNAATSDTSAYANMASAAASSNDEFRPLSEATNVFERLSKSQTKGKSYTPGRASFMLVSSSSSANPVPAPANPTSTLAPPQPPVRESEGNLNINLNPNPKVDHILQLAAKYQPATTTATATVNEEATKENIPTDHLTATAASPVGKMLMATRKFFTKNNSNK